MRDRAGNEGWLPAHGWLRVGSTRVETLRVVHRPADTADWRADEWPVAALGLPPLDRLLGYRRVEAADAELLAALNGLLTAAEHGPAVSLVAVSDSAVGGPPSWEADLEALRRGRLPRSRADLLLQDIQNGAVPEARLPDPDALLRGPGVEEIRQAIRFRRLHRLPRQNGDVH
jgi:hypothetical protein